MKHVENLAGVFHGSPPATLGRYLTESECADLRDRGIECTTDWRIDDATGQLWEPVSTTEWRSFNRGEVTLNK